MIVEVTIFGSDGDKNLPIKIDYLWDEEANFRTYGLTIGKGAKAVRVTAEELEEAMRFCRDHQGLKSTPIHPPIDLINIHSL